MEQIHRLPAHGDGQRLRNRLGADAVQRGFLLINHEPRLGLVVLDIPIRIHDAGRALKNLNRLAREGVAGFLGRPVNLGDECLQHRRPRWHFRHRDPCAKLRGNRCHPRSHALGDVVTLRLAFAFGYEVHLNVRDVRSAAHEVMPHQTVEVEWRRYARVNLIIRDLWLGANGGGDFTRGLRGAFEGAAFGHVEDNLELALVVERQHLHLHPADAHQRHRCEQQAHDAREKNPAPLRLGNHRPHETAIELGKKIFGMLGMQMDVSRFGGTRRAFHKPGILFAPAQNADARPRRNNERDEHGPEHCRARADRNRAHVWPHQTADERHGQHRGDHGKRCENRGVADFTHGLDRDGGPVATFVLRQMKMADDVFDDDDGIVYENPNGKDQCEQRDAI